ncbi:MAG: 3-isopropylmalate dehydratase small subunit [Proteobacteria bacterium]|nr:MAG: 3-isopropylmalate dehydratase small subunit [Pseudomonadota bacterium]
MSAPSFTTLRSTAVVVPGDNIDTDQITPAEFLKSSSREGLGRVLFAYLRQAPEFPLNRPQARGAKVLVAGDNFGCGSSREHAPWALYDWGFRALVSTRFADIFKNNCLKNGILPIEQPRQVVDALVAAVCADPGAEVCVDLAQQTLTIPGGQTVPFAVDPFCRHCLLGGIDEIGYILSFEAAIEAYERRPGT